MNYIDYWADRNALVSAAKAAAPSVPIRDIPPGGYPALVASGRISQGQLDAWETALRALKDFDAANGGTPVL